MLLIKTDSTVRLWAGWKPRIPISFKFPLIAVHLFDFFFKDDRQDTYNYIHQYTRVDKDGIRVDKDVKEMAALIEFVCMDFFFFFFSRKTELRREFLLCQAQIWIAPRQGKQVAYSVFGLWR